MLIAKFSSLRDEWDVIAWEKTALDLAERACITVPGRRTYPVPVCDVVIHNTDDHLRNHGFLRADGGWAPSPVFDINPNPDIGVRRELAIGVGIDPADGILALREVAPSFGVDRLVAEEILNEVFDATRSWRECAGINGLPARELSLMEDAFAPCFSLR